DGQTICTRGALCKRARQRHKVAEPRPTSRKYHICDGTGGQAGTCLPCRTPAMKLVITASILLSLTLAASAKPVPADRADADLRSVLALAGTDIDLGPAGSPAEVNYFSAPPESFNAGSLSCRMQTSIFDKMRLTQACSLGTGTKQR